MSGNEHAAMGKEMNSPISFASHLEELRKRRDVIFRCLCDVNGFDADTPPGVLADWLEEHGQRQYAEYVRKWF